MDLAALLAELEAERVDLTAQADAIADRCRKLTNAINAVSQMLSPDPQPTTKTRQDAVSVEVSCVDVLRKKGPVRTAILASETGIALADVKRAMKLLESDGRAYSTGSTSGQRWHLGPPPTASQEPKSETRGPRRRPSSAPVATDLPADRKETAVTVARRFGHVLGPFKASGPGSVPGWVARCTACDTYVSVTREGKVVGPGTRHDCLAAGIGT